MLASAATFEAGDELHGDVDAEHLPHLAAQLLVPLVAPRGARDDAEFDSDALADGRKLRVLTVLDTFTRECVALEVGGSFGGAEVARVLTRAGVHRGLPETIHVDNGTEFTSKVFDQWAYANRVKLDYSRPGKPTDNAFIESFNAQVRRECLSQHYFSSIIDARVELDAWRDEYNNRRPHGSLGQRTPAQFRAEVDEAEAPEKLALSVPERSSVG